MVEDPTLSELWRQVQRLETRLDGRVVGLTTYQAERAADRQDVADLVLALADLTLRMEKRLDANDARITWALRAGVTGLLLPMLILFIGFVISRAGA